jgi:mannose-1-phosphate guanylyltransferase
MLEVFFRGKVFFVIIKFKIIKFHRDNKCEFTILGTEATEKQSVNYGCIVEDSQTHQVLHYVEKPETYISTTINCGIYLFKLSIFEFISQVYKQNQNEPLNKSVGTKLQNLILS